MLIGWSSTTSILGSCFLLKMGAARTEMFSDLSSVFLEDNLR